MELSAREVVGLPGVGPRALAVVPWRGATAYVACAGTGAFLARAAPSPDARDDQLIYFWPPSAVHALSAHAASPSPTSSPVIGSSSPRAAGTSAFEPAGSSSDAASICSVSSVSSVGGGSVGGGSVGGSGSSGSNGSSGNSGRSRVARVNRAACVDAAAGFVAVGEHGGQMPRLLLFDLASGARLDFVRDQHQFGVHIVRFAPSGRWLASLGTPQDGFLYIWSVAGGRLVLRASNRCISEVCDLRWINDEQLLTVGLRHVKLWHLDGDSAIFAGRNVVLGPLADQQFECALPVATSGGATSFLVGTAAGGIYKMPENLCLKAPPAPGAACRPIRAMALADRRRGADASAARAPALVVGTAGSVTEYAFDPERLTLGEEVRVHAFGAAALLALGSDVLVARATKKFNYVQLLPDGAPEDRPQCAEAQCAEPQYSEEPSRESKFLMKRGIKLRACLQCGVNDKDGGGGGSGGEGGASDAAVLAWNGSREILAWPATLHDTHVTDVTVADGSAAEPIIGTLSGDLRLHTQTLRAHSGPITDVHMVRGAGDGSAWALSAGRDRTVQLWARPSPETPWSLKQTLMFSTPVLKARLAVRLARNPTAADGSDARELQLALVCCGANKTVYVYKTSQRPDAGADAPLFSAAPRSFVLKGMPLDIGSVEDLVALSSNDRLVTLVDAWADAKSERAWRPLDSNGDAVNLSHIQPARLGGGLVLFGAASNKSVLLHTLTQGDLLACQWGHAEPISGLAWTGRQLITASDVVMVSELVNAVQGPLTGPVTGPLTGSNPFTGTGTASQQALHNSQPLALATGPAEQVVAPSASGLPRLDLPKGGDSAARASPPLRKVYSAPGSARSRSVSPARSGMAPAAQRPTPRSPSPPPRAHTRSPALERGRPLSSAAAAPRSLKLADRPSPRLAHDAPPRAATAQHQLVAALNEFLSQPLPPAQDAQDAQDVPALRALLSSALGRLDGDARVRQPADQLADQLASQVADRIANGIMDSVAERAAERAAERVAEKLAGLLASTSLDAAPSGGAGSAAGKSTSKGGTD